MSDEMPVPGLLGKKLGMTRVFQEDGSVVAVTAIEAGPCVVTQVKNSQRDGYDAVQLGFGEVKKLNEPESGHLKKAGANLRYLKELRLSETGGVEVGQKVSVSVFAVGDKVDIIGESKGKGFAGGVKRHHFRGGPRTHGQSDRERAPGAMGSTTTPGRTLKGQRMAGHMGADRVTAKAVSVVKADPEKNLLLVKGSVPGGRNGLLLIKKAGG